MQTPTSTDLSHLSVEQKLDLVQDLWDTIAAQSDELQVPEWHRRELEQRLATYRRDPDTGTPWHVLRDKLLD